MIKIKAVKYDIVDALHHLVPGSLWKVLNDELVEWNSLDVKKPTSQEIENKIAELDAAEPMRLLRIERDRLLTETDWLTAKAMETEEPISANWKTYRQALRDLPATAEPKLENGILTNVTWPEKPE